MTPYRPEFTAALEMFARISNAMTARKLSRPVLVGGAAVEIYSLSSINTGDFDIVQHMAPDSKGNLYTGEIVNNRLVQRFILQK